MSKSADGKYEQVHVLSRAEWRAWLEQNHASSPGIWLVYYKKATGQPRVDYADAVEEALCFGWIDSTQNALDDQRAMQFYAPRRPKSTWSKINKQRVEKLTTLGLIAPAGQAKIDAALRDGSWNSLDEVEALLVPADLQAALDANPTAQSYFSAFPPSARKAILQWLSQAKRPETRAKRIEETVRLAAENIRANQPR